MREEYVIIEPFSGRYYSGTTEGMARLDVAGTITYFPFKTYEDAEATLKTLRVAPYTRLKIEKHYFSV